MTLRWFLWSQVAILAAFVLVVVAVHATASSQAWLESLKLSVVIVGVPVFTGFAILLWLGRLNINDPDQRFGARIFLPGTAIGWWLALGLLDDAYDWYGEDFFTSNLGFAWMVLGLLWLAVSAAFGRPRVLLPYEYRHPATESAPERLEAK